MTTHPNAGERGANPRWHRRKETRPAEILEAALQEFVERGYAATRLDDIARRAGCTKGTIFLYFATKEELFKAVVREHVVPRILQAEQTVEQHAGSARELLEKVLRTRWQTLYHSELSGLPKLMFAEAGNFPDLARFYHDEVIARSQAIVKGIVQRGIERGEFRPVDAHSIALVASAPMLMAALWKHSFSHCVPSYADARAYFEASLDNLLSGLTHTGTTGGGS
ncbi:MAG: TetR/AcrR family transcriptional regulator [Candidatus Eisenbacteria bacterium]|nr:TetR/AcrR family transcriptional regulator [Candidatus Eisenbacteria bacterium]